MSLASNRAGKLFKKRVIGFLISSYLVFASVNAYGWALKDVWNNLHSNTTNPGNYHDAAAGYWSGGSSVMRTKNTAISPVAATAPSLKHDCNSIDAFLGSFSMISGAELVTIAENIGSQAIVYGFHLGMKTYAPQIEQILSNLRNLAMTLNQAGIGQCVAAKAAWAAVLPKKSAMYETVCKEMAADSGADLGEQRKKCKDHLKQKAAVDKKQKADPDALIDNYNIFVKAANAVGIPREMHESLMSMVGTIVVKDGIAIPYPSLANDRNSWNIYINGGSGGSMYRCNNADCLTITVDNNVTIAEKDSYAGNVRKELYNLKAKMFAQTAEFNAKEKGFIDSIGQAFPIFDHLTLEAATGVSIISADSQLIARYILLEHIQKVTRDIKKGNYYMRGKQLDDSVLKDYGDALDKLMQYAERQWMEVMAAAEIINDRAEKLEKHLLARERG